MSLSSNSYRTKKISERCLERRSLLTCLICLLFFNIRVGRARLLFDFRRDFSCKDDTTARTLTSSPEDAAREANWTERCLTLILRQSKEIIEIRKDLFVEMLEIQRGRSRPAFQTVHCLFSQGQEGQTEAQCQLNDEYQRLIDVREDSYLNRRNIISKIIIDAFSRQ